MLSSMVANVFTFRTPARNPRNLSFPRRTKKPAPRVARTDFRWRCGELREGGAPAEVGGDSRGEGLAAPCMTARRFSRRRKAASSEEERGFSFSGGGRLMRLR